MKAELAKVYGEGGEKGKDAILSYLINIAVDKAMLRDRQWIEVPSNATKHNLRKFKNIRNIKINEIRNNFSNIFSFML